MVVWKEVMYAYAFYVKQDETPIQLYVYQMDKKELLGVT